MFRADCSPLCPRGTTSGMRTETETLVDEIKQAIALLRRHL
jgi:hypothetical protein